MPFVTEFGAVLGVYQGVEGRSNGSDYHYSGEQNYMNGTYTGVKYQCVEFARRWLLLSKGLEFHAVGIAAQIWNIKFLQRVSDGRATTIKANPNGSRAPPLVDSIIIWKVAEDVPFGHIAIITEVNLENNYVRIAEQNVDNDFWPGNYSREFKLDVIDGCYFIIDEDEIYGWMVVNYDIDAQEENKEIVKIHSKELEADNLLWLDIENEIQQKYIDTYGKALRAERSLNYFTIDAHLAYKIHYVTMDLASLITGAINHVLKDHEVLAKFGLPHWTWQYITDSWNRYWRSDGKQVFTRLEIGFNGKDIKVLGLSGDTTEGLLEAAELQDKYAAHHGLDLGQSSSRDFSTNILNPCKNAINGFVHIYVEPNEHDQLRALHIQKLVSETGNESKFIRDISEVRINTEGKFVDNEDREIKIVWKFCDWKKVFDDFERPHEGNSLKISDLLLCEDIRVLEPIWKVLVSSPAMLPILWELSPNNRALLRAEWNEEGYFSDKPSVKKPYGYHSSGEEEPCVFVEAFETEKFGEFAPIAHSWSLMRSLSGFILVDSNNSSTPFMCCRIVGDT